MTQEETILSQRGDQYLKEFDVAELDNRDKEKFSNLREYDKELKMLEDWLVNPRIDKDDFLMFDCSIEKEKIEVQNTELSYNLVDSSRESKEQQQCQEKNMQVYHPKDRLDMEIEELSLLMVKMSQRRREKRMKIFISRAKKQNSGRGQIP